MPRSGAGDCQSLRHKLGLRLHKVTVSAVMISLRLVKYARPVELAIAVGTG
jgi:hypothetical protein